MRKLSIVLVKVSILVDVLGWGSYVWSIFQSDSWSYSNHQTMARKQSFSLPEANKLKGVMNFFVLKFKMRCLLSWKNVWELACPPTTLRQVIPIAGGVGQAIPTAWGPTTSTIGQNLAVTRIQNNKAFVILIILWRMNIPYIIDITDLKICWLTLQNLFESQNVTRTLYFINKLHSMKMEEGKPMYERCFHGIV
jgi:hypothetical protein